MALSHSRHTGDGTTTEYAIQFSLGFLTRSDVYVYVDGVGVTFTWLHDGLIKLDAAPLVGAGILIRRIVEKEVLVHDYEDGAVVVEKNLDDSNRQTMMISHEVIDGFFDPDGGFNNDLNMNLNRILNIGEPVDLTDAATRQYVDTAAGLVGTVQEVVDAAEAVAVQTAADLVQTTLDTIATAADRVAVAADLVQTDLDTVATAADRVQTGLDRVQTGLDRVQTGLDVVQTAADLAAFDEKYVGSFASAPVATTVGQIYFDTTLEELRVWTGAEWRTLGGEAWNQGVPDVIAVAESVVIPAGRTVVHPNLTVDGTLTVEGTLFVPSGGTVTQTEVDVTDVKGDNYFKNDLAMYACRAWVNFDGTTTPPTIRASENVSSVVRNGVGDFTVNFTNVMVDAEYSVTGATGGGAGTGSGNYTLGLTATGAAPTTSEIRVQTWSTNNAVTSNIYNNVAIFR